MQKLHLAVVLNSFSGMVFLEYYSTSYHKAQKERGRQCQQSIQNYQLGFTFNDLCLSFLFVQSEFKDKKFTKTQKLGGVDRCFLFLVFPIQK